jgi:hypothetical protein
LTAQAVGDPASSPLPQVPMTFQNQTRTNLSFEGLRAEFPAHNLGCCVKFY